MKRCRLCNYKARTLDRLCRSTGGPNKYECSREYRDKCDARQKERAKRIREQV